MNFKTIDVQYLYKLQHVIKKKYLQDMKANPSLASSLNVILMF